MPILFPDPLVDVQRAVVAGNLYAALRGQAERSGAGMAFPPGLFYALWKAGTGVDKARVPDASFVRADRLPNAYDSLMPFQGAPDLAACVVTQTDPTLFALEHVRDYLAAGTEQVWLIFGDPLFEVQVFRRDEPGTIRAYRGSEPIDAAPTLPGLTLTVAQVFAMAGRPGA